MANWIIEFHGDDHLTIWDDGSLVATGHGTGRAGALLDAWTTLVAMERHDLGAIVAQQYKVLTGADPAWPGPVI